MSCYAIYIGVHLDVQSFIDLLEHHGVNGVTWGSPC